MKPYDIITFECPDCRDYLSVISRGGGCNLEKFKNTDVPLNVAEGIKDDTVYCLICRKRWGIDITYRTQITISIYGGEEKDG